MGTRLLFLSANLYFGVHDRTGVPSLECDNCQYLHGSVIDVVGHEKQIQYRVLTALVVVSFSNNVGNVTSKLQLIYSAIHGLTQCDTRQTVMPSQKQPNSAKKKRINIKQATLRIRFNSQFLYSSREF